MGVVPNYPHPHPDPPLEGEGEFLRGVEKSCEAVWAPRPLQGKESSPQSAEEWWSSLNGRWAARSLRLQCQARGYPRDNNSIQVLREKSLQSETRRIGHRSR